MTLEFCYDMQVSFSAPVTEHHYALMCLPKDSARQRIRTLFVTVEPEAEQDIDTDYFENQIIRGQIDEAHDAFRVKVQGTADTGLALHEAYEEVPSAIYRVFSKYTNPGTQLRAFYKEAWAAMPEALQGNLADPMNAALQAETAYDRAHYWMNALASRMEYRPGITDVHTMAEEAFALGQGVCQDYAHIYLSLLRLDGINARYVVGMMAGEGASHAWVEVNCKGYWYGFDPANRLLVNDQYIKISHGRDYADCIVTRGIFRGAAEQTQQITVTVKGVQ